MSAVVHSVHVLLLMGCFLQIRLCAFFIDVRENRSGVPLLIMSDCMLMCSLPITAGNVTDCMALIFLPSPKRY